MLDPNNYPISVSYTRGNQWVNEELQGPLTSGRLKEAYQRFSIGQNEKHPYQKLLRADSAERREILKEILQFPCYSSIGKDEVMFAITGLGMLSDTDSKVKLLALKVISQNTYLHHVDASMELMKIILEEEDEDVLREAYYNLYNQGRSGYKIDKVLEVVERISLDPVRTKQMRSMLGQLFRDVNSDMKSEVRQKISKLSSKLILEPLSHKNTPMSVVCTALSNFEIIYNSVVVHELKQPDLDPGTYLSEGIEHVINANGELKNTEDDIVYSAGYLCSISKNYLGYNTVKKSELELIDRLCVACLKTKIPTLASNFVGVAQALVFKQAYISERLKKALQDLLENFRDFDLRFGDRLVLESVLRVLPKSE
jgi:hypothetical protein